MRAHQHVLGVQELGAEQIILDVDTPICLCTHQEAGLHGYYDIYSICRVHLFLRRACSGRYGIHTIASAGTGEIRKISINSSACPALRSSARNLIRPNEL